MTRQDSSKENEEVSSMPNSEEQVQPSHTCYELISHVLIENKDKKMVQLCLYKLVQNESERLRSAFGCLQYRTAFHVNLFAAFHRADIIRGVDDYVYDTFVTAQKNAACNGLRKQTSSCIGAIPFPQFPVKRNRRSTSS